MQTTSLRSVERTLTELDFVPLCKLPNDQASPWLTRFLDGVDVVDTRDVPSDTVTMYSTVDCQDLHTGRRQQFTICYPNDAEPGVGFVSMFSPVGCSLLGLRVNYTL